MKGIFSQIIFPASLLATTIIGAGMFALPFLFNRAGLGIGLFYLLFFGVILVLIHLMYADIIVRTPENHRFPGYAKIYLGKFGYWSSIFMAIFGALLALTIYLVLSPSFIKLILPATSDIYVIFAFWLLGSLAIFFKINELAVSEFLIFIGMAAMIFMIFGFGLAGGADKIKATPLFDFGNIFLPFGAVLFSMYGRSAIPTLLGYFRNNGQSPVKSKWPIIIGTIAPALIYAIFVFGILGLSGEISEDAVSGLIGNLPKIVLWVLGILGIISLWSTYIVIGRDIKKSLEHDFNLPVIFSGGVVSVVPVLLYVAGFQSFLKLISFSGAIIIGLEGIFIVLMWLRARNNVELIPVAEQGSLRGAAQNNAEARKPEKILDKIHPIIIVFLLLVFAAGIGYKLIY
ncbi:MAG: aromatic amino acid transport family protein [Patescibacteria group bacterium]